MNTCLKTCFTLYFTINVWGVFGFACNRIRLVTTSKHPYRQLLDVVYVKTDHHRDGQPVFESEKGGVYGTSNGIYHKDRLASMIE